MKEDSLTWKASSLVYAPEIRNYYGIGRFLERPSQSAKRYDTVLSRLRIPFLEASMNVILQRGPILLASIFFPWVDLSGYGW